MVRRPGAWTLLGWPRRTAQLVLLPLPAILASYQYLRAGPAPHRIRGGRGGDQRACGGYALGEATGRASTRGQERERRALQAAGGERQGLRDLHGGPGGA